ncbi:MAG: cell division protein FtsL [Bacillota bacterium]
MLQRKKSNNYNKNNHLNYDKKNSSSNFSKKVQNKNKKLIFLYALILLILGLIFVLYIGQTLTINHLNFKASELENELEELNEENDNLNLKIAQDISLSKVEDIAKNQLNMKEPEQTEVVELENNEEESETDIIEDNEIENGFLFTSIFEDLWEKLNVVSAESFE